MSTRAWISSLRWIVLMLWENSLYKIWIIHDEHILQEIKTLVVGHRNGSFLCVRQSSNSVAHFLAKLAKSISDDVICMKDPPPPAFEALFFDVNASLLWMEVCFPQLKKKKKKKAFFLPFLFNGFQVDLWTSFRWNTRFNLWDSYLNNFWIFIF